jgi:hypothetical protein
MLNHLMNNLQIRLLEGTNSLINFALAKKFDEHLLLPWPGRRIWEEHVPFKSTPGKKVAYVFTRLHARSSPLRWINWPGSTDCLLAYLNFSPTEEIWATDRLLEIAS